VSVSGRAATGTSTRTQQQSFIHQIFTLPFRTHHARPNGHIPHARAHAHAPAPDRLHCSASHEGRELPDGPKEQPFRRHDAKNEKGPDERTYLGLFESEKWPIRVEGFLKRLGRARGWLSRRGRLSGRPVQFRDRFVTSPGNPLVLQAVRLTTSMPWSRR
jgi:hypothetical protein